MSLLTWLWRWAALGEARLGELVGQRVPLGVSLPTALRPLPLAAIVQAENAPYDNPARGAHVGRIDAATAAAVAALIEATAASTGLPVWYLAGCIARESRFSPDAYNENLSLLRPRPSVDATDWGIAQRNGKWSRDPGETDEHLKARLLDAGQSLAWFGPHMAGLVAWANRVLSLPGYSDVKGLAERWASNVLYAAPPYLHLWLATYGYNSGTDPIRGAVGDLRGPKARLAHPNAVMSTAVEFQREMGA